MRRPLAVALLPLLLAGCAAGHASGSPSPTPDEAKFLADVQAIDTAQGFELDAAQALQVGYAYCKATAGIAVPGGAAAWLAASGFQDDPELYPAAQSAGDLCPQ